MGYWSQSQTSPISPLSSFLLSFTDVGAYFEEGMWLRYNFQAPGANVRDSSMRSENGPEQPPSPDLAHEDISFSFSTTKAPCILLYVSSLTSDFLAVLVKPTGEAMSYDVLQHYVVAGVVECSRTVRMIPGMN